MKNELSCIDKDQNEVSYDYGNIFELEQTKKYNRLLIAQLMDMSI